MLASPARKPTILNGEKTCQGSGFGQRRQIHLAIRDAFEYLRDSMIPNKKLSVENDGERSWRVFRGGGI
jgi:hypothetical protein